MPLINFLFLRDSDPGYPLFIQVKDFLFQAGLVASPKKPKESFFSLSEPFSRLFTTSAGIVYSLRFDAVEIYLWATWHAFSLHHCLSVRSIMLRIGSTASLFVPFGQSKASIILKSVVN